MAGECKNCGNELASVCMQCHACMGCTNPDVQQDRITALEEALRVLADECYAWRTHTEENYYTNALRSAKNTDANPIAAEAVRKAGG